MVSDELTPNGEAQVLSAKDYYPFGMSMPSRTTEGGTYRYGFNGKEKDTETDLNDFGARFYAANLGRWLSIDPLKFQTPGITPYRFGFNNPIRYIDSDGKYESDGHYWTIYMIGLMIGLKPEKAREIAFHAEKWDTEIHGQVAYVRTTYLRAAHQQETHALSGGNQAEEEFITMTNFLNADPGNEDRMGQLLHRYGDCYAHARLEDGSVMYGNPIYTAEHAFADGPGGQRAGRKPDLIHIRPDLYTEYVASLAEMMAIKYSGNMDGFDKCKFENLSQYAAEKNVSLLGIINYEVAKMQGQNEFFVHKPVGPEIFAPTSDYLDQVKATREYLDKQNIQYTTEEIYIEREISYGEEFPSAKERTTLGTKFTIQSNK